MRTSTRKKKTAENIFVISVVTYPLLLFVVFYIGVNFSSILMAFQKIDFQGNTTWYGLNNFKDFITQLTTDNPYLNISLINSLKMYIINLVISMPLYILFSYVLFKKCFLHKTIRVIVMTPSIVSSLLMSMVFLKFIDWVIPDIALRYFGIEGFPNLMSDERTSFGMTLFYMIWTSFCSALIIYPNAMNSINPEIIEAGKIDGVSTTFQELRYIILPLIWPTLTTFLVTGYAAILSNSGPLVLFYMYDAPYEVYNMGYYYFIQTVRAGDQSGYPVLAAGGLIMTLLVAPTTHLLNKLLYKIGPEVD